jgi:hypothetical protein
MRRKIDISKSSMIPLAVAFVVAMGFSVTACGGGTSNPPATASSTPSASPSTEPSATATAAASPAPVGAQPSSGAAAQASVKADWTAFFDPATPIAQRTVLLQNGDKFTSYLRVQAQPGVAHLTTEQVTAVTLIGTQATVTYNILINGVTNGGLSNQTGDAIFSNGTWQVSDPDFCNLLTLENKGKTVRGC